MNFELEVIAFNIESCRIAQDAGAHRIELCDGPGEGGTTPSYGFIKAARKAINIQLYPIIRPRGGDFLYSDEEFQIMIADVLFCKQTGCDGVVIGLLHADGTVDKARTKQLVELAYPMGVTFHRAFDRAINPLQALEDIIETGCERILTSGQKPQAIAGAELISTLIQKADNRIVIMPGSGVRSDNIAELVKLTGADCFHSSARKMITSQMTYSNPHMNETLQSVSLDEAEVKAIIDVLENLV